MQRRMQGRPTKGNTDAASCLWGDRVPIANTIAKTYLSKVRGHGGPIEPTLAVASIPTIEGECWPRMVAEPPRTMFADVCLFAKNDRFR